MEPRSLEFIASACRGECLDRGHRFREIGTLSASVARKPRWDDNKAAGEPHIVVGMTIIVNGEAHIVDGEDRFCPEMRHNVGG